MRRWSVTCRNFLRRRSPIRIATWRARVTVRMLLLHDSGLPAHRDFYKDAKGHEAVLARVMAEPLVHEPGTQIEYSDLGFILLGEIIERLDRHRRSTQFAQGAHLCAPWHERSLCINPPRSVARANCAHGRRRGFPQTAAARRSARRKCVGYGRRLPAMRGFFPRAGDMAAFAQMLLNGGIYAHQRLLTRATIQEFTARQAVGDSARALWAGTCRRRHLPSLDTIFRRAVSATPDSPEHRSGSIRSAVCS